MISRKTFTQFNFEKLIYVLVTLLSFIFVMNKGAIYFPDSEGYLQMSLFRSCGYPIFIQFHKYLFGGSFIPALLFTQFLLNFSASYFLSQTIQKIFILNKWLTIILFTVLIFPIFIRIKVSNSILSEAIAYPLYLLTIGNLLLGMTYRLKKYFYSAFILAYILILVRGQFLFLIPAFIIAVLITYTLFSTNSNLLILSVITIPFLAVSTDITFHKLIHNQAVTTPWTGIQIATIPFFISDKDDYLVFKNKEQQEYFKFIYNKLEQKKLLQNQIPKDINTIRFFTDNYCLISNSTLHDDGIQFFNQKYSKDQKIVFNDKINSSISIILIKNNFKKYIKIYIDNFIEGFEGTSNLLLLIILLPLSFFTLLKNSDILSKATILLIFLCIGNILIIATAEKIIERYTFYNNWTLIAIILILLQNYFQNKTTK